MDVGVQSEGDVNLHPRLVEALSEVPYSALYGVLWPTIVEQASFETREQLSEVNDYYKKLCHPYRRSDRAKSSYVSYYGNKQIREGIPFVLELSLDLEWRCWGADKCGFTSVEAFRAFCDVGDVDPDDGRRWEHHQFRGVNRPLYLWIWMSRKKDIVFETSANPLENGYCHYFGLTGVADKAIAMYNFMHDNYGEDELTIWAEMIWSREYC